jgi:isocitrate dehydrogenase
MYKELEANETKIVNVMKSVQGHSVEIGGYYLPDDKKAETIMRPSAVFNQIIDSN